MERVGLTFAGDIPLHEVLAYAKEAEAMGYDSAWVAEHYLMRDSVTTVAAIASGTNRLKVGTGIVSPYTRHLALLAMTASTLAELSRGRFVLGLGTNARFVDQLGVNDKSPLSTVRKTVEAFTALARGEEVDLAATFGHGGRLRLSFPPSYAVPVYLGAIGPKMLELAGEIADGVILSAGASPSYIGEAVRRLQAGRRIGRNSTGFEIVCYVMTWEKGDEKAATRARERLVRFLSLPGRETLLGGIVSNLAIDRIRERLRSEGPVEAAKLVGEDALQEVSISGTEAQCKEGLAKFRKAGVTLPVLSPMGKMTSDLLRRFIAD